MTPNANYPALDSVDICPKCATSFGKALPNARPSDEPELHYGCKSVTDSSGHYSVFDEWIKRTCPTCQYSWRENVWSGGE